MTNLFILVVDYLIPVLFSYFSMFRIFYLKDIYKKIQMQRIYGSVVDNRKLGGHLVVSMIARSQEWIKECPVCNRNTMPLESKHLWRNDSRVLCFSPAMFGMSVADWKKITACFSKGWRLAKRAKLKITEVRIEMIGHNSHSIWG